MTKREIKRVFSQVESELIGMNTSSQNIVLRTRNSLSKWVRSTVYNVAHRLGYIISFPARVINDFVNGLWNGMVGKEDINRRTHNSSGGGCMVTIAIFIITVLIIGCI